LSPHHRQKFERQTRESTDLNGTLNHRPDLLGDAEPSADKKSGNNVSAKGLLPPGAALDLERVLAVTGGGDTRCLKDYLQETTKLGPMTVCQMTQPV
jgi:hypothetical protein